MNQKYTSANTSVNSTKLPKTFTFVKDWSEGTVNLDFGGGKFDNATEYLKQYGVENLVYDPFNRSEEHNQAVISRLQETPADTVTCNNVLNVIDDDDEVQRVIARCSDLLKKDGVAYFKIYEGDRSGIGRATKLDCYQRNQAAEDYLARVRLCFGDVVRKGDIIVATKPSVN